MDAQQVNIKLFKEYPLDFYLRKTYQFYLNTCVCHGWLLLILICSVLNTEVTLSLVLIVILFYYEWYSKNLKRNEDES